MKKNENDISIIETDSLNRDTTLLLYFALYHCNEPQQHSYRFTDISQQFSDMKIGHRKSVPHEHPFLDLNHPFLPIDGSCEIRLGTRRCLHPKVC